MGLSDRDLAYAYHKHHHSMPIYKLAISPHVDEADRASGYAIADSEAEAWAVVGRRDLEKITGGSRCAIQLPACIKCPIKTPNSLHSDS